MRTSIVGATAIALAVALPPPGLAPRPVAQRFEDVVLPAQANVIVRATDGKKIEGNLVSLGLRFFQHPATDR